MRTDRAVILLSSTSWTSDEDFSVLHRAMINLDRSLVKRRAEGEGGRGGTGGRNGSVLLDVIL